jgi:hypothetical protein
MIGVVERLLASRDRVEERIRFTRRNTLFPGYRCNIFLIPFYLQSVLVHSANCV